MMMRPTSILLWILVAGILLGVQCRDSPSSQSIPAERPRTRPPSYLTGRADWEKAEALLKQIQVPPAPPLSPQEALKTFRLAPGYRLELVAAEPMVIAPIFFEFDPDGRIWVVEYQGYMRDLQGSGEGDPICRVVVLEDTNGDGAADKSTVFLDGLVMPRSLSFVKGGVLIAEPPNLWFCQDTTGDLRCDRKTLVGTYGHAGNPQHTANGLRYGIDNWLHSADTSKRHRFVDGRLIEEETILRGQWGVTFDAEGRFLTCYENSPLHADFIPPEYVRRNQNLLKAYQRRGSRRGMFGINVNIGEEANEVFPIRVTPAITLGALELRDDGRLRTYTIAAGPSVYDGHQFPDDAYGNVFVPEAGGHLVGRLKLSGDIELKAERFYPAEQELLASTDERFRPVNSRVGPDGALYIADMYRGIIEHVIFMVPYLEKQIEERRLAEGSERGRIYRIVYEGNPIDRTSPGLSTTSSAELVSHLSHRNGWWRLTAQRLLVERRDPQSLPLLQDMARTGSSPLGRLHALWTIQGLDALDWAVLVTAFRDEDDRVRSAAVRLSEQLKSTVPVSQALDHLARLSGDPSRRVRLQVALTAGSWKNDEAERLLSRLLRDNQHSLFRVAAITGLQGRELEFLSLWLQTKPQQTEHDSQLAQWLAEMVMGEGDAGRVERLLGLVASASAELQKLLLDGMANARPGSAELASPLPLGREPQILIRLARSEDETVRRAAYRLLAGLTWPGAPALRPGMVDVEPWSPEQKRLAELGEQAYARVCSGCHQPDGGGLSNVAPRLAGSPWVTGSEDRLIRIILQGLYGPIEVDGEEWNSHMPGLGGSLSDQEIAGILTYGRRAWGNAAGAVSPERVAGVRQETAGRTMAWTAAELEAGAAGVQDGGPVIRAGQNGELRLPARQATTYGRQLAYRPSLDILAPWRHEEDAAQWHLEVPQGGPYEVWVTLAADDESAGDRFIIATEHSQTVGEVLSSGGYSQFREYSCGTIQLRPGLNRLVMRAEGPLKQELADIRALRLVPLRRK